MRRKPICVLAILIVSCLAAVIAYHNNGRGLRQQEESVFFNDLGVITLYGKVYQREEKHNSNSFYLDHLLFSITNSKDTSPFNETSCFDQFPNPFPKGSLKLHVLATNPDQSDNNIAIGDVLMMKTSLQAFDVARNPGNFSAYDYYHSQGLFAQVFISQSDISVYDVHEIEQESSLVKFFSTSPWHIFIDDVHEQLVSWKYDWIDRLKTQLGEEDAGILAAMVLGESSAMDKEQKNLYQKCGIAHVLAISGLHMSFFGRGIYRGLRRIGISFVSGGSIALLFLLLYIGIIDWGMSSVRAFCMLAIHLGADMSGRSYHTPTALGLASTMVLLWRPQAVFDAAFLLSFGAILATILILPLFERANALLRYVSVKKKHKQNQEKVIAISDQHIQYHFNQIQERNDHNPQGDKLWQKLKKQIFQGLTMSISIQLLLLPILLYFYFEFSPYSMFLNLLVIPLMAILLTSGILGIALMLFPWIGSVFLWCTSMVLHFFGWLCQRTVALPFSRLVWGRPALWQLIVYYLLLVLFWLMVNFVFTRLQNHEMNQKLYVSAGKMAMALLVSVGFVLVIHFILALPHFPSQQLSITMLDVGQGDSIFMHTPQGENILIDGGSTSVNQVGTYRILPFLLSKGIGSLDAVMVSHSHEDHINGISELLQKPALGVHIQRLIITMPDTLDDSLKALVTIAQNQHVSIIYANPDVITSQKEGQMSLTPLWPDENYASELGNNSSMVLDLKYKNFEMLFMGDLEADMEQALLKQVELGPVEVLKAGHHGSKTSSSEDFLNVVQPQLALVSAGINNRYHHPSKEVIERYQAMGIAHRSTQQEGAITITTKGDTFQAESFLGNIR